MPPLRPLQWLLYSPVAALPMIAALFIQHPLRGRANNGFNLADYGLLIAHHWFWLVFTLGLGGWVGWFTATKRRPVESPAGEEDAA